MFSVSKISFASKISFVSNFKENILSTVLGRFSSIVSARNVLSIYLNSIKSTVCSDFCNDNNGIFVPGYVFFLQAFLTDFFYIIQKCLKKKTYTEHKSSVTFVTFFNSKGIVVLSLNLKRYFTCDHNL